VYEWIIKLKNSGPSVTDEERPGLPSTSTADENITGVYDMILDGQEWLSMKWLITCAAILLLLIESLKTDLVFIKSVARWVPKLLTGEHKFNRLTIVQRLLNYNRNEGKRQSMKRKNLTSQVNKNLRSQPSTGEVETSHSSKRLRTVVEMCHNIAE
jgi:hypothetical protein